MVSELHTLYRVFDRDGVLLYVGMTSVVPSARLDSHRKQQFWWGDVTSITLENFDSAEELAAAEIAAIRSENPVYNVRDRTEPKPSQRKTPQRTIVVDPALWDDFGAAAVRAGSARADVIRNFIRWYNKRPGVAKPGRPAAV